MVHKQSVYEEIIFNKGGNFIGGLFRYLYFLVYNILANQPKQPLKYYLYKTNDNNEEETMFVNHIVFVILLLIGASAFFY